MTILGLKVKYLDFWGNKKPSLIIGKSETRKGKVFLKPPDYARLFTCLVNLDFWLAAFFQ